MAIGPVGSIGPNVQYHVDMEPNPEPEHVQIQHQCLTDWIVQVTIMNLQVARENCLNVQLGMNGVNGPIVIV